MTISRNSRFFAIGTNEKQTSLMDCRQCRVHKIEFTRTTGKHCEISRNIFTFWKKPESRRELHKPGFVILHTPPGNIKNDRYILKIGFMIIF